MTYSLVWLFIKTTWFGNAESTSPSLCKIHTYADMWLLCWVQYTSLKMLINVISKQTIAPVEEPRFESVVPATPKQNAWSATITEISFGYSWKFTTFWSYDWLIVTVFISNETFASFTALMIRAQRAQHKLPLWRRLTKAHTFLINCDNAFRFRVASIFCR